jgi:hypothetical protein
MFHAFSPTHRFFISLSLLLCCLGSLIAQVPPPPTGATTITRIEEATGWKTCGACGNTGGGGSMAAFSMTRGITSPNVDGSATEFQINGPTPYTNAYWYIPQVGSPSTPVSYLKYEFYLYVPSASATAPQAIEFECQQKASGRVYNFAWQANYRAHIWRIFDFATKKWIPSPISFNGFSPDKWHHVIAEYHASGSVAVNDALTIDGVRHVVGIQHPAPAASTGHYLTNGFQLDLNSSATPFKVYVDGMTVTFK